MVLEKLNKNNDVADQSDRTIRDLSGKLRTLRYKESKLIKASETGRAAIMISPDVVDISAPDRDNSTNTVGISVIGQSGTVIRGPVGFTSPPSDIRIAGLWKFNDVLLSAAPSTIMTPIPVLRFSLPLANIAEFIQTAAVIGATAGLL